MDTDKKSNGALIGSVIVILILILGGVYIWSSNSLKDREEVIVTNQLQSQGQMNEANALEADLSASITEEDNTAPTDFSSDVEAAQ